MIPNLKMGYFHQREYLERPCNIQNSDKFGRKPMKESMEGFEYSSLLATKTYSILSYIVGGFVGSKSQMNNNKHNLSYDLSAAVFNLLNPCKYEREKNLRKGSENLYNTATKLNSEGYDKYIVKSSHNGKVINLGLNWLENYICGFHEQCYNSNQTKEVFNCDERKDSSDMKSTRENSESKDCLSDSVDVTDRVSVCEYEAPERDSSDHSINCLGKERSRLLSECSVESTDSESFIVFDGADDNYTLENFDFDSDDDEDEDEDENEEEDKAEQEEEEENLSNMNPSCPSPNVQSNKADEEEYEIYSDKDIAEANDKWLRNYENVETEDCEPQRKVRFSEDVKVNKIVAWDYAYRAARAGPWEQMARDRARFRERILRLSPTISPILKKKHRDKIYKTLYS